MTFARIKKRCSAPLFLLLLLAVSAGLSPQAVAHSGGRVYPIVELTDEMLEQIQLDDGTVDEWFELIGEPAMTLLDFQTNSNFLPPDPSNLDFRIWLAWHDDPDRLYLAFVASDDLYQNEHDYDAPYGGRRFIFVHDHITLAIDGDHSGGEGFTSTSTEEELVEAYGQTQRYQAIARTVSGPLISNQIHEWTGVFSWKLFPPYGDAGGGVFGEAPTISVIELYVTPYDRWGAWDEIEETEFSDLAAGQVIGFAIMVTDRDDEEIDMGWPWIPEAMKPSDPVYGTEVDIGKVRADFFLDGILLPADTGPEGTAVESVSWGRIKASLEME